MLAVAQRRAAVLRSRSGLRGHLELANLAIRKTTVVVRALLRLSLLVGLWRGRRLAHGRIGGFAVAREVYACWSRGHLALGLEETRLEVDDVVAELVVLRLQRLVQFA